MSKNKSKNKKKKQRQPQSPHPPQAPQSPQPPRPPQAPQSPQSPRPLQPPQPPQPQPTHNGEVRLSQCMIVKNEEKHIERALGWARGFAFEQIVVDTGSTDRTVELAEKLGATVYHFKWINDFAAAKNYAMDMCKGDWIAILDADEYMPGEDVKELMAILQKIQSDPEMAKKYEAISNSWVQLDDNDNVTAVLTNQRVFRNSPELRYVGKIHETIDIKDYINATNLRIMHTGYTQSTFKETDKRIRNIKLLRDEMAHDPDNAEIMIYLADSIKADGTDEDFKEAEELYFKALGSKKPAKAAIKRLAYDFLIRRFMGIEERKEEALELCNKAIAELPDNIDYYYCRGALYNGKGNYAEAWNDLEKCEKMLMSSSKALDTRILLPSPIPLFIQLKITAKGLNDEHDIVRNNTIINEMLKAGKADTSILSMFIKTSLIFGASDDEVLSGLDGVYDLKDPNDLLFIARTAKDCGAIGFTRILMEMASVLMNGK